MLVSQHCTLNILVLVVYLQVDLKAGKILKVTWISTSPYSTVILYIRDDGFSSQKYHQPQFLLDKANPKKSSHFLFNRIFFMQTYYGLTSFVFQFFCWQCKVLICNSTKQLLSRFVMLFVCIAVATAWKFIALFFVCYAV